MNLSGHEGEAQIPITTPYSHSHNTQESSPPLHQPSSNGPLPLSTATMDSKGGVVVVVKYKECLKNHAASIGGNATDGCGEFMPSGEEGTIEALSCSACSCHRNFHRKEVEGQPQKGLFLVSRPADAFNGYYRSPRKAPHPMVMPLGAAHTSESDEMPLMVRKRFRTKFTAEQKEKMLAFAERVGWKLQKLEDSVVQHFCQEIGVKRRVLKVWMHNNKHNLASKNSALHLE